MSGAALARSARTVAEFRYGSMVGSVLLVSATVANLCAAATILVPGDLPTIQTGIDAASAGDTVLVGPGTYLEQIVIDRDVVLVSSDGAAKTTIDAELQGTVVTFDGDHTATVDGFTITRGRRGLEVRGEYTISNNVIELCENLDGGAAAIGAVGPGSIRDNVVRKNKTLGKLGGTILAHLVLSFTGNVVQGNWAGTEPVLELRCGVHSNGDLGVVSGNLVTDNLHTGYGAASFWDFGLVESNTFVHTTFSPPDAAVQIGTELPGHRLVFRNNIVATGEGVAVDCSQSAGTTLELECNDAWSVSGKAFDGSCSGVGSGNISLDPLFCDPANRDYLLSANSPCAPEHAPPGCGLIGALDVGCAGTTGVGASAQPGAVGRAIKVVPNPVRSLATFELTGIEGPEVVDIYSASGRRVATITADGKAMNWRVPSNLRSGVYFAHIDARSVADRFLVVR